MDWWSRWGQVGRVKHNHHSYFLFFVSIEGKSFFALFYLTFSIYSILKCTFDALFQMWTFQMYEINTIQLYLFIRLIVRVIRLLIVKLDSIWLREKVDDLAVAVRHNMRYIMREVMQWIQGPPKQDKQLT